MNGTPDREVGLLDYAHVVASRKWIVVTAVLAAMIGAVGLSALQKPIYEASAEMLVSTRSSDTIFGNGSITVGDPKRAVLTEIKVLESEPVAQRAQKDLALAAPLPDVKGTSDDVTDVVTVTVRSGDPTSARLAADAYVQAYIEIKREQAVDTLASAGSELQKKVTELQTQIDALDQQATGAAATNEDVANQRRVLIDQQGLFKQRLDQLQVDTALTTGGAQVVRPAEQPGDPVEPTPVRDGMLALVVGLLLGLGVAFLVDFIDDSIHTTEDLEQASGGLPVLAVVPVDTPTDNRPIAIARPDDFVVEAYKSLRTGLQFLSLDSEIRVIQVTSAVSGEGKTTTAANLAVVFARAGHRVVLVDADLRKPRLREMFALADDRGLTNVLLGDRIELSVHGVMDNLDVMPAGPTAPNPSEMLGGRQMRALIQQLAGRYAMVILDSAPVLPVTDSVTLAASVQGVLLVTQEGQTSTKQIGQALARLEQVQAHLVGTVLNQSSTKKRGGYGGYGGYGYGAPPEDRPHGQEPYLPPKVGTKVSTQSVPR
jgi:succinoglycan biosynthesis transport protein ExoP